MKNHKELNDDLLKNFLDRTFFKAWKISTEEKRNNNSLVNYSTLEFDMNPTCSLDCKYCYLSKHSEELMPKASWNNKKILDNLKIYLEWMKKNNFHPNLELFSGEPLVQNIGYEILDTILDWYDGKEQISISVPTNMDFLHYPDKTKRVFDYFEKFRKKNVSFFLSASVDGKYLEENRPHRSPLLKYDDAFYEKLFDFCSVTGTGFHPMVYSNGIEKWKDNFLWFQGMFEKYGLPWDSLYLLEVRNQEWSAKQCLELEKLIRFVTIWAWDKLGHNSDDMMTFLFKRHGYNILTNTLSTTGRGIGCSIQSTMQLRLGDLKFYPCHRTSYNFMEAGEFVVKDGKIDDITSINPALFFAINGMDITMQPMCTHCAMRAFCQGGCLGSQYETTGELFSPIPTVCRMFYTKLRAVFRVFEEIGILPRVLSYINRDKVEIYKYLKKENIL